MSIYAKYFNGNARKLNGIGCSPPLYIYDNILFSLTVNVKESIKYIDASEHIKMENQSDKNTYENEIQNGSEETADTANETTAAEPSDKPEVKFSPGGTAIKTGKTKFGHFALGLVKKNVVLIIAICAALVTCIFVPFDAEYGSYFDLRTLSCLFCTLAVVAAFRNIHFFVWLADVIVRRFGNMRNVILALVGVTYFGSMIMANDMALVTFLPLGYFVLEACGNKKAIAFTFIMQNVAANLGGMLTPFGNPQNLYLYSYYEIETGEFFRIMSLPFAVAFVLILGVCLFVKPEKVNVGNKPEYRPPVVRSILYAMLFALSVMIVFRVFPYYWGLLAVFVAVLILDARALLRVDYGLLLTFCAFFVFSGNLARIEAVKEFLGNLVSIDPLAFGVLSCQFISNVPSSVLLSHFTLDYTRLLVAVNIGGLGTPIASLASLITLNTYRKVMPGHTRSYLGKFSAINFSFLAVLLGSGYLTAAIL